MGNTSSTADDIARTTALYASTGSKFGYSSRMHAAAKIDQKVHDMLDPKRINSNGEQVRECLDSVEHPLTIPVVVAFDETGSMHTVPGILQENLAQLKGITLRSGLVDAQLCFGAYGDSEGLHETAPLQLGHFESGVEMGEWLNNLFLEGNGGGNGGESSSLLMWFLGEVSRLDSFTKRGKKGYLFLVGDEISLPVTREEIVHYAGIPAERGYSVAECIAHCARLYDIHFLLINNTTARAQHSLEFWSKHLGSDRVIIVENPENISPLIGSILALKEGVVADTDQLGDILKAEGSTSTDIAVVTTTLASYATGAAPARVATAAGTAVAGSDTPPGIKPL